MEEAIALARAGFDIAHPFDAARAAAEPGLDALAGGRRGLLIGNTRALWPHFSEALPALAGIPDPLEHYTERAIDAAFPGARIYYAHRRYGAGFLPMQRLAVMSGLGGLSPTQLVIHPVYGPWFALRAIVLVPGDPPAMAATPRACHCDGSCEAAFARASATTDGQAWLAVRDACRLREWRYPDDQVRYHYERAFGGEISPR